MDKEWGFRSSDGVFRKYFIQKAFNVVCMVFFKKNGSFGRLVRTCNWNCFFFLFVIGIFKQNGC